MVSKPTMGYSRFNDNPHVGFDGGHILHPSLEDVTRALSDPMFELTGEEFAEILRAVAEATRAGYTFDDFCVALLKCLQRQLAELSEDSERCVDDGLEDVGTDDGDGLPWRRVAELAQMTRANNSQRRIGQNIVNAVNGGRQ